MLERQQAVHEGNGKQQFPKLCFLRIQVEEISFSTEVKGVRQDMGVGVGFVRRTKSVLHCSLVPL